MKVVDSKTMENIAVLMDNDIRETVHREFAPCSNAKFLKEYVKRDPEFADILMSEFGIDVDDLDEDLETLVSEINAQDTWNDDLNRKLCEMAGIEDEYDQADSDTFESVVYKAADMLGVEI